MDIFLNLVFVFIFLNIHQKCLFKQFPNWPTLNAAYIKII